MAIITIAKKKVSLGNVLSPKGIRRSLVISPEGFTIKEDELFIPLIPWFFELTHLAGYQIHDSLGNIRSPVGGAFDVVRHPY
jgi:hypothetical protein